MLKTSSSSSTTSSPSTTTVTMSLSSSSSSPSRTPAAVVSPTAAAAAAATATANTHHSAAVAGYAAGVTGTIVGYPLDTLKLWMQTNRTGENRHLAAGGGGGGGVGGSNSGSSGSSNSGGFSRGGGLRASYYGGAMSSSSSSAATSTAASHGHHRMQSTVAASIASKLPSPTPPPPSSSSSTTTITAFARHVLRARSNLQALYSGVSAPLMTVGIVQSINFAVYDSTRRYLFSSSSTNTNAGRISSNAANYCYRSSDPIGHVAVAGFVSGTATAVVTAPLILVKTHQQITGSTFRRASGELLPLGGRIVRAGGFLPHLVCETFGRAVYYATYESTKRTFGRWNQRSQNENQQKTDSNNSGASQDAVSLGQRMVCAATSGILCWSLIYPLDSLRSRVYSEFVGAGSNNAGGVGGGGGGGGGISPSSSSSSSNLVSMIRKMHNEKSFYRGFRVTVLRAGPVAAVVLPVYDLVLDSLSSASTSS